MNLLPMRYFLTVVELESISKAAARLHITQQTLSAHMAALEKELSCRLFQRRPEFQLTYAGEVFLRYCKQYDSLMASMKEEFADIAENRGGVVKIGIAHTRGKILLPEVIARYRGELPDMQVHICEATNDVLLPMLLKDEIDLMVGNFSLDIPELTGEELFSEEICMLYSPLLCGPGEAAPRDLAALADYPFLLCDDTDLLGRVGRVMLDAAHIVPEIAAKSSNLETLLRLCVMGCGVCFCTDYLAAGILPEAERDKLVILPTGKRYSIGVAWKNRPYTGKACRRFAELLKEAAISGKSRC